MRLEVDQIAFGYGSRLVGQDISFTLDENEVLVLFGPNGAGKTTLFKTLLGLVPLRQARSGWMASRSAPGPAATVPRASLMCRRRMPRSSHSRSRNWC